MICKKTIKQRKALYGNNFLDIAKLQSEYYILQIHQNEKLDTGFINVFVEMNLKQ